MWGFSIDCMDVLRNTQRNHTVRRPIVVDYCCYCDIDIVMHALRHECMNERDLVEVLYLEYLYISI